MESPESDGKKLKKSKYGLRKHEVMPLKLSSNLVQFPPESVLSSPEQLSYWQENTVESVKFKQKNGSITDIKFTYENGEIFTLSGEDDLPNSSGKWESYKVNMKQ
jgi:hypothetical protein